jgi:hypothetical protein
LSHEKAAGGFFNPWIILCLHSLLNGIPKEMGSTTRIETSSFIMFISVAYVTLSGMTFLELALKTLWGWTLAKWAIVVYQSICNRYLVRYFGTQGLILLVRTTYGANLINFAIFGGAFAALGMEGVKVICIAWASAFVPTLLNMKNFRNSTFPQGPSICGWPWWLPLPSPFCSNTTNNKQQSTGTSYPICFRHSLYNFSI